MTLTPYEGGRIPEYPPVSSLIQSPDENLLVTVYRSLVCDHSLFQTADQVGSQSPNDQSILMAVKSKMMPVTSSSSR